MYDLRPHFDEEVEPGTNLLLTGPPLTGKRSLMMDVLAAGTERGDGAIVVTTKDGAERVLKDYQKRTAYEGSRSPSSTASLDSRASTTSASPTGSSTSSPVDMTGIGIKLSEFLQAFGDRGSSKTA